MDQHQLKQNPENTPEQRRPPSFLNTIMVIFVMTFLMNTIFSMLFTVSQTQINYSQFIALVESDSVSEVSIEDSQIELILNREADADIVAGILDPEGKIRDSQILLRQKYYTGNLEEARLGEWLYENNVTFTKPVTRSSPILEFISSWIMPIVLIYLGYNFLMRTMANRMGNAGGGMFNIGRSKAKEYSVEQSTGVTFADVAGQEEAKESLADIIDYLHHPDKYMDIGAQQPKGALLVGPPGTGKTLLAKAVAGEAKVAFYSLSGSDFIEMFVGVGASRVRDLFEQAKKSAPCIIFIDEIDAIGKSRDNQFGGNDEREQTLNQLLAEMDGFDTSKGIVVLAATNRPEVLDKALLRPGRFDRRVIVEKPDLPGREAILHVHAARVKLNEEVNLHDIALSTPGATGADLANMVNEAALRAVKLGREVVLQEDLQEAVEVVIAGKEKKDRIMNPKERRMVAYHEVGHALVSALQKDSQPVQKITIVPRTMGSLGYTMNMPEEERYLLTQSEMLAQVTALLGGRAAEVVEFGEVTTGASNDIERATRMARSMVTQYGMSEKFGSMGLESIQSQYLDGRAVATCSEQTNFMVDEEVRRILDDCQQAAVDLLRQNLVSLRAISEALLESENISGTEFMRLLRQNKEQV